MAKYGLFEGLLTSPRLSATYQSVYWQAFDCLNKDGIWCRLEAGSLAFQGDPEGDRIDVICVQPVTQYGDDGEITYTGQIGVIEGNVSAHPVVPSTPPGYFKVAELLVGSDSNITLRQWRPSYARAVMLRPIAQLTPDMTVKVNFFRGYLFGNSLLELDEQDSPLFFAPSNNKCRRDLLAMNAYGILEIIVGQEADLPNYPPKPDYPSDKLPICEIFLQTGDSAIDQSKIKDVRPISLLLMADNIKVSDDLGIIAADSVEGALAENRYQIDRHRQAHIVTVCTKRTRPIYPINGQEIFVTDGGSAGNGSKEIWDANSSTWRVLIQFP